MHGYSQRGAVLVHAAYKSNEYCSVAVKLTILTKANTAITKMIHKLGGNICWRDGGNQEFEKWEQTRIVDFFCKESKYISFLHNFVIKVTL